VQASRRLLIDTIRALTDFIDAITVVGAHAVHMWVQDVLGSIDMQATRDADVVVNPVFVTPDPKMLDIMAAIGVTPALPDRPGVFGYTAEMSLPLSARTTIDLIVPETYAGPGRRSARIQGHYHAAGRAVALELAIWDRQLRTISNIEDPADHVDAWVAGPAALLVAKAHKVHERLVRVSIRPDRLRPKDSGDIALLMLVSNPDNIAATMVYQASEHSEIAPVVKQAIIWLIEMYADPTSIVRHQAADALADRFEMSQINDGMDAWLTRFGNRVDQLSDDREISWNPPSD